jgi:hypothetical protein
MGGNSARGCALCLQRREGDPEVSCNHHDLLKLPPRHVGNPNRSDFAGLDQLEHRAKPLVGRGLGVPCVDLVHINVGSPEPRLFATPSMRWILLSPPSFGPGPPKNTLVAMTTELRACFSSHRPTTSSDRPPWYTSAVSMKLPPLATKASSTTAMAAASSSIGLSFDPKFCSCGSSVGAW